MMKERKNIGQTTQAFCKKNVIFACSMSKHCKFAIFLMTLTMLWSCSEPLPLEINEEAQWLLECELSPTKRIEARLVSLGNFNDVESGDIIENAIIDLGTDTDLAFRFQYDSRNKIYYIPLESYKVNPSIPYTIKASRFAGDPNPLEAKTTIPAGQKLVIKSQPKMTDATINGTKRKTINLKLALPNVDKEQGFFRLFAYRKVFNKIDNNGQIVYVPTGITEMLEFAGNNENPMAFHQSAIDGSVLFDVNRVNKQNFELLFNTAGVIVDDDHFENIYYTLEALSESSYRYNLSKSRQIKAELYGNSDPVINYRNMVNGYGYLGGCNPVSDSIAIQ